MIVAQVPITNLSILLLCFVGGGEVVTRGKNKDRKFCMRSILLIIMENY